VQGQYRKNSLMGILASEVRPSRGQAAATRADAARPLQHGMSLGRLCPVHRLDRNVSGLLVFARGAAAANELRLQIMARNAFGLRNVGLRADACALQAGDVVKEYVAVVVGAFPEGPACIVDAPLLYDYKARP